MHCAEPRRPARPCTAGSHYEMPLAVMGSSKLQRGPVGCNVPSQAATYGPALMPQAATFCCTCCHVP